MQKGEELEKLKTVFNEMLEGMRAYIARSIEETGGEAD